MDVKVEFKTLFSTRKITCAETGGAEMSFFIYDVSAHVKWLVLKRVFLATFQHKSFLACAETGGAEMRAYQS